MELTRWLHRVLFPRHAAALNKAAAIQRSAVICECYRRLQNPQHKSNREDLLDLIVNIAPPSRSIAHVWTVNNASVEAEYAAEFEKAARSFRFPWRRVA